MELQVHDLVLAMPSFNWLFAELGYIVDQDWSDGRSWALGNTYLVVAQAPHDGLHDRRMAGLSHLAFHAGPETQVDRLWSEAPHHGWSQLYAGRHPRAGGEAHYAAFLENGERFKVELVASPE